MWQEIEDEAWEYVDAGEMEQARLAALRVIQMQPDAIDSYVILARTSNTLGEKIAFAREAVRLGEIRFADEIEAAPSGDTIFWADLDTRPYMRGLCALALSLWEDPRDGAQADAIATAQHALRICPNDNVGFRFMLLEWLARHERWDEGRELAETHADDYRTEIKLWAALYAFHGSSTDRAGDFIAEAREINPDAIRPLLLKTPPKDPPGKYIALGSPDEAKAYAAYAHDLWRSVPGAIDWLKTVAKT
ncbi:MAG: hypothetical protein F4Y84_19455 [Caldilineaceae bacterium SB0665_bin_25]|nr:hypothetical protein [Caldilineaceae bacterium SB0665_bin_25]